MGLRIEINADFGCLIGSGKLVGKGYNIYLIRIGFLNGLLKGFRRRTGGLRSDGRCSHSFDKICLIKSFIIHDSIFPDFQA